jgi:hypothetical protein
MEIVLYFSRRALPLWKTWSWFSQSIILEYISAEFSLGRLGVRNLESTLCLFGRLGFHRESAIILEYISADSSIAFESSHSQGRKA